jgi:hypothetical protein
MMMRSIQFSLQIPDSFQLISTFSEFSGRKKNLRKLISVQLLAALRILRRRQTKSGNNNIHFCRISAQIK